MTQSGQLLPTHSTKLRGHVGASQAVVGFYDLSTSSLSSTRAKIVAIGDSTFMDQVPLLSSGASDGEYHGDLLVSIMNYFESGSITVGTAWPELIELENKEFVDARLTEKASDRRIDQNDFSAERLARHKELMRFVTIAVVIIVIYTLTD
jgi:hypothetical protein